MQHRRLRLVRWYNHREKSLELNGLNRGNVMRKNREVVVQSGRNVPSAQTANDRRGVSNRRDVSKRSPAESSQRPGIVPRSRNQDAKVVGDGAAEAAGDGAISVAGRVKVIEGEVVPVSAEMNASANPNLNRMIDKYLKCAKLQPNRLLNRKHRKSHPP